MSSIFDDIIENKKKEIDKRKKSQKYQNFSKIVNENILKNQYSQYNFVSRILKPKVGDIGVIAEVKLKSPSEGPLGFEKDAVSKALSYQNGYADAVSVVVDEMFFGGSLELFKNIRKNIGLPMLFKDFIIDEFQIQEALYCKADAILLLAKLDEYYDQDFHDYIQMTNITPIVEVSTEQELDLSINHVAKVIGVNARDLDTFEIDVERAEKIIKKVPKDKIVIGFSGVNSREEVEIYKKAGARAVLVGTSMMQSDCPIDLIRSLNGLPHYDKS